MIKDNACEFRWKKWPSRILRGKPLCRKGREGNPEQLYAAGNAWQWAASKSTEQGAELSGVRRAERVRRNSKTQWALRGTTTSPQLARGPGSTMGYREQYRRQLSAQLRCLIRYAPMWGLPVTAAGNATSQCDCHKSLICLGKQHPGGAGVRLWGLPCGCSFKNKLLRRGWGHAL